MSTNEQNNIHSSSQLNLRDTFPHHFILKKFVMEKNKKDDD